ncbi:hypothetical protein Pelo_15146 [Pelomyxa schiedti]|nr:hypothetical protein Pelo_15146 [Pelomyxa schiedti]
MSSQATRPLTMLQKTDAELILQGDPTFSRALFEMACERSSTSDEIISAYLDLMCGGTLPPTLKHPDTLQEKIPPVVVARQQTPVGVLPSYSPMYPYPVVQPKTGITGGLPIVPPTGGVGLPIMVPQPYDYSQLPLPYPAKPRVLFGPYTPAPPVVTGTSPPKSNPLQNQRREVQLPEVMPIPQGHPIPQALANPQTQLPQLKTPQLQQQLQRDPTPNTPTLHEPLLEPEPQLRNIKFAPVEDQAAFHVADNSHLQQTEHTDVPFFWKQKVDQLTEQIRIVEIENSLLKGRLLQSQICTIHKGEMGFVELSGIATSTATPIGKGCNGSVYRAQVVLERGETSEVKEVAIKMMYNLYAGATTKRIKDWFDSEHRVGLMHPHWCLATIFNAFRGNTQLCLIPAEFRSKYVLIDENYHRVEGSTSGDAIQMFNRTSYLTMELGKCTLEAVIADKFFREGRKPLPADLGGSNPLQVDRTNTQGTRGLAQLAFCCLCACDNLNSHAWYHCDIKLDNIILVQRPTTTEMFHAISGNIWAFCDLGTSLHCPTGELICNRGDSIDGNAANRSPEIVNPEELLPRGNLKFRLAKNDVWAVGCVLFEAICGKHPCYKLNQLDRAILISSTAPFLIPDEFLDHTPVTSLVPYLLERDSDIRPTAKQAMLICGALMFLPPPHNTNLCSRNANHITESIRFFTDNTPQVESILLQVHSHNLEALKGPKPYSTSPSSFSQQSKTPPLQPTVPQQPPQLIPPHPGQPPYRPQSPSPRPQSPPSRPLSPPPRPLSPPPRTQAQLQTPASSLQPAEQRKARGFNVEKKTPAGIWEPRVLVFTRANLLVEVDPRQNNAIVEKTELSGLTGFIPPSTPTEAITTVYLEFGPAQKVYHIAGSQLAAFQDQVAPYLPPAKVEPPAAVVALSSSSPSNTSTPTTTLPPTGNSAFTTTAVPTSITAPEPIPSAQSQPTPTLEQVCSLVFTNEALSNVVEFCSVMLQFCNRRAVYYHST